MLRFCIWFVFLASLITPVSAGEKSDDGERLARALKRLDPKSIEGSIYALEGLQELGPAAVKALPRLMELLRTADEEIRLHIALTVGKIGKGAVPAVTPLLEDGDPLTRFYAAWSLGQIGPDAAAAVPKLLPLMRDKDASVRRKTIYALRRINVLDEGAARVLVGMIADPDVDVRPEVQEALVATGPPAVPLLEPLLEHKEQLQRETAFAILAKISTKHDAALPALVSGLSSKHYYLRVAVSHHLSTLELKDAKTIAALGRALSDSHILVCRQAALALKKAGAAAKPATSALVTALLDMDAETGQHARDALSAIGHDARPDLRPRLRDKDRAVRLKTAQVFLFFLDERKEATPVLLDLLKEEEPSVRLDAALLLTQAQIEGKAALGTAAAFIENKEQPLRELALTIAIRWLLHEPSALDLVLLALQDPAPAVRARAVMNLKAFPHGEKHGLEKLLPLLKDADKEVRLQTLLALEWQRADPKVCIQTARELLLDKEFSNRFVYQWCYYGTQHWPNEVLLPLLDDYSPKVRTHVLEILGERRVPEPWVMKRLTRTAVEDRDAAIRHAAMNALTMHAEPAMPYVLSLFRSQDDKVRGLALHFVMNSYGSRIGKVVPDLIAFLEDPMVEARRAAAHALSRSGKAGTPALGALKAATMDADAEVRNNAQYAIKSINGK